MSALSSFVSSVGSFLFFAIAFLFVITVVIFFHELGHFLVARWCGVNVKVFSIGFGREIWGFYDRHGTRWRFAWVPLGGYVKFLDDDNAASAPSRNKLQQLSPEERAGAFHLKPLWKRALVVAAGPLANFVLAIVIFAGLALAYGVTVVEPRVGQVMPNTPAAAAGFQAGDLVLSIDGRKIDDFGELQREVSLSPGRELTFEVERKGAILTLKVQPELRPHEDPISGKYTRAVIGIQGGGSAGKVTKTVVGPVEALQVGVMRTWDGIAITMTYLRDVILLRQKPDQLRGVLSIAHMSGEIAKLGLASLINWIAILSVGIGLVNLFPIPVLDGGHLMFYALEAIRGRPLSERSQEFAFRIGLVAILMLIAYTLVLDRHILSLWFKGTG